MSAPTGYAVVESESGTFAQNVAIFSPNIPLPFIPGNLIQLVQIQITTGAAAQIEVTFDGTNWDVINNGNQIFGVANFTLLVEPGDALNFRHTEAATIAIDCIVSR